MNPLVVAVLSGTRCLCWVQTSGKQPRDVADTSDLLSVFKSRDVASQATNVMLRLGNKWVGCWVLIMKSTRVSLECIEMLHTIFVCVIFVMPYAIDMFGFDNPIF